MDKLGSHLGDNFKLLRENIIIMTGVLMLYSIIENIEYISTKILFIFVFVFYFVFRKYNNINIILCLLTVTFLFSVIFFVFKIQCYYCILPNHKNITHFAYSFFWACVRVIRDVFEPKQGYVFVFFTVLTRCGTKYNLLDGQLGVHDLM